MIICNCAEKITIYWGYSIREKKEWRCVRAQRPKAKENWPITATALLSLRKGGGGRYLYSDGRSAPPALTEPTQPALVYYEMYTVDGHDWNHSFLSGHLLHDPCRLPRWEYKGQVFLTFIDWKLLEQRYVHPIFMYSRDTVRLWGSQSIPVRCTPATDSLTSTQLISRVSKGMGKDSSPPPSW